MAEQELTHHGVRGMKWGVRRYQPYTDGKKGRFLGKKKSLAKAAKEVKGANIKNTKNEAIKSVIKSYKSDEKKIISKHEAELSKAEKALDKATNKTYRNNSTDADYEDYVKKAAAYDMASIKSHEERVALGKKYADTMNTVLVSEQGYKNIEKGKKYLERKNLDITVQDIETKLSDYRY